MAIKKSVIKAAATKAASKKVKKAKKSIDESRKIIAAQGMEKHFYKGFPRGLAYALLVKAPKRTMVVSAFLDKIEKLAGVKSRAQARGIVSKMVDKPAETGARGVIAHFV